MESTEPQLSDLGVVCLADAIIRPYQDSERRGHMRLSMDDIQWLRSARLKYGPDVRVIDISVGGILIESETALRPDSNIVFELAGPTGSILIPSRVLRCRVSSLNGVTRYRGACAFKRPLTLPELNMQTVGQQAAPAVVEPTKMAAPSQNAEPVKAADPAKVTATTWQKVVARFNDGRLVRGYTNDFHPSKPQLHLSTAPNSRDTLFLQMSQLKALFFVRDFAGDPSRVDSNEFARAPQGRKIAVTFNDGEVLIGSTLGYRGDGQGFFVQPADAESNNLRVFVAPGSAQHVRFL